MTQEEQVPGFYDSLVEQLAVAADAALEMLEGRQALDPVIVLSTMEACGLLEDDALPTGLEEKRAVLVTRGRGSEVVAQAFDALDLQDEELDVHRAEDEDEAERRLVDLVELSAVMPFLDVPRMTRLDAVLIRNEYGLAVGGEQFAFLWETARQLLDELHLPDGHPTVEFLRSVEDAAAPEPTPLSDESVQRAFRKARARMARGSGVGGTWVDWLNSHADALGERVDAFLDALRSPTPVLASAGGSTRMSASRLVLAQRGQDEELSLVVADGLLLLEWGGDRQPPTEVRMMPDDVPLPSAGGPVASARYWRMQGPPEAEAARLRVLFEDDTWEVVLGDG